MKGRLIGEPDYGDTRDRRFPRKRPAPERDWIGGKPVTKLPPGTDFGRRRSGIPRER
jgi:hypothetical protein